MDIQERTRIIQEKINTLNNADTNSQSYNSFIEDILFLASYKNFLDDIKKSPYQFELLMSTIEEYLNSCDNEQIKSVLKIRILIPNMLKYSQLNVDGELSDNVSLIGTSLLDKYTDDRNFQTQGVMLNELQYALEANDSPYLKNLIRSFHSNHIDEEQLNQSLYKIYSMQNKKEVISLINLIYGSSKYSENLISEFEQIAKKEKFDEVSKINNSRKQPETTTPVSHATNTEPINKISSDNPPKENLQASKSTTHADKLRTEQLFSQKHQSELKSLIDAFQQKNEQEILTYIRVFDELPGSQKTDFSQRLYNLYCHNPNSAIKLAIDLYNRGNLQNRPPSKQLSSAQTATLNVAKRSIIDSSRRDLSTKITIIKSDLSTIINNYNQKSQLSSTDAKQALADLNALRNQVLDIEDPTSKEIQSQISVIDQSISQIQANYIALKEMESIINSD